MRVDDLTYPCVRIDTIKGPADHWLPLFEMALWTNLDLLDILLERLGQHGWQWIGGITIPEFHPMRNGLSSDELRIGGGLWMVLNTNGRVFYSLPRCEPSTAARYVLVAAPAGPEPRNNDGRSECFWCHVSTAKRGGGMYDICPKCGR